MYSTRMAPMVVPVAAGMAMAGDWVVLVLSVLGLLLVMLLAVRAIRLRDRAAHDDRLTEGHHA